VRYLVGRDAQGIAAAQSLVPTVVRDRMARIVTVFEGPRG